QQAVAVYVTHWGETQVVEDHKLDAGQALEESRMTAVTMREAEHIEEPRQPLIQDGVIIPAGLVAKRASNPTFADAGRPDDQQVLMPIDPLAGHKLLEQRLVEPACCLGIDILDDGVLAQACEPQASDQPLVVALG